MDSITAVHEAMGHKSCGDCYCHIELKDKKGHAIVTGDAMLLLRIASEIVHRASTNIGISYEEAVELMVKNKERRMAELWQK